MSKNPAADVNTGLQRRESIAAAAIDVLATRGVRGLTHRAVDAEAGLNPGAVNYHAPTRERLIQLALEEVFSRDFTVAHATFADIVMEESPSANSITDAILRYIDVMTSPQSRNRVIARHVLLGEAQHDADLRELFDSQRAAFVSFAEHMVTALRPRDGKFAAETVVIVIDGLIHRQVMSAGPLSPDALRNIITRILGRRTGSTS